MSFFINDLQDNTLIGPFGTMEDVTSWWSTHVGRMEFNQLNVTGKDTHYTVVEVGFKYLKPIRSLNIPGMIVPDTQRIHGLRRYQVVDEKGKSYDIRSWPEKIWEPKQPTYTSTQFIREGRGRRAHGPSMHRKTQRAAVYGVDYEDLYELGLPLPVKDISSPRKKALIDSEECWHYYDMFHVKSMSCSKCWKDQHKTMRQWGKHKPGFSKVTRKDVPEDTETLFSRLACDGFPVVWD